MASLKHCFFMCRDRIRFMWARNRFAYIPDGKVEDFSLKQMHHIVIIRFEGKLGDTQVMTHFYRSLREQIPDLVLSVVCSAAQAPIYSNILGFDQVEISSRKPHRAEIEGICQRLCGDGSLCPHVDMVLTTHPFFKPRDFIFNFYLRPSYVAGCVSDLKDKEINLFLFDHDQDPRHVTTCFTDFLTRGQLEFAPVRYERLYRPEVLQEVKTHLLEMAAKAFKGQGQGEGEETRSPLIIGINPCGGSADRYLTIEMVSTFVKKVFAQCQDGKWGKDLYEPQPVMLLLMCPPSLQDFVERVKAQVGQVESAYCTLCTLPQVDMEHFAAYVGAMSGVVTVDTAVVHLACASEVPQICFYRNEINSATTQRWCPYGDKAIVVGSHTDRLEDMDADLFVSKSLEFVDKLIEQHATQASE